MRWIVVVVLVAHGLIHLMGFAKAFGMASPTRITESISRRRGLLWLAAALLMLATAVMLAVGARSWWLVGALGLVISQAAILSAWKEARAGTIANLLLLPAMVFGWSTEGPGSFRAQFERDVAARLNAPLDARPVTAADVAALPVPVQGYLRAVRAVGEPRVRDYRLRFRGRIRGAPDERWMPFEAVQQSFADRPARFFLMRARRSGIPVEAFHRMVDGHATMQVRLAGMIPLFNVQGDAMDRSELVTLLNDMCLLAPATLLGPGITWESVDGHSARVRLTNGPHTVAATLVFGDDSLLASFVSDDRSRLSADGQSFTRLRFTTPVRDYRDYGPVRLASYGEARWSPPSGEFAYGEFHLEEVEYNRRK